MKKIGRPKKDYGIRIFNEYGRLKVVGEPQKVGNKYKVPCLCECGNLCAVYDLYLSTGWTRSCGCLQAEDRKSRLGSKSSKGIKNNPLHGIWYAMIRRCRIDSKQRNNYYDRGIKVCEEWSKMDGSGFINWFNHVGERPEGTSLDRINNDGNYEPGNVRWTDRKTQNNNRRKSCAIQNFTDDELFIELKRRNLCLPV